MTISAEAPLSLIARAGPQGLLLLSGYGAAQALSFARNALLGHWLSQGDFGIAATITLFLQLFEAVSDLGSDRLIVQAANGDSEDFLATSHCILIARGILLSVLLLISGPTIAQFFNVAYAASAFQVVALVPSIKGFMHLDCRRAQRHLDNRPQMLVEVLPQAMTLLATARVLTLAPGFYSVVWLSLIQAMSAVAISHWFAERPYRVALDRNILKQQIAFGWPILLSALPLIAVYQGDRIIVGRLLGIEDLAKYSAAFMITMVPGLLAAKTGHALMLPILSDVKRRGVPMRRRFTFLAEGTTLASSLYFLMFAIAGEAILPLVFGAQYHGLGGVLTALAGMWTLRMIQAVPGMALMAASETKPFLVAGLIRASVLPLALSIALQGGTIAHIAGVGVLGEFLSLLYVSWKIEQVEPMTGRILLVRALFLAPVVLFASLAASAIGEGLVKLAIILAATAAVVFAIGVAVMPSLRAQIRARLALQSATAAN